MVKLKQKDNLLKNIELFSKKACSLIDDARVVCDKYFRKNPDVSIKKDDSPVTIADKEIENLLREGLKKHFPDHNILGEEGGYSDNNSYYTWVIDPIDGTKAFAAGIPTFGIMVGLAYKGKPILGIVDQPISKERWVGIDGKSTTLNEKIITTRRCENIENAVFSTTDPYFFKSDEKAIFDKIRNSTLYNIYGKDCYAYMLLATGYIDIVLENGLKPHDFCALVPIIKGAGGFITDWNGDEITLNSDGHLLVCGSKELHTKASNLIK